MKVPSNKGSSGIRECIQYMRSPNIKLSYRRIQLSGRTSLLRVMLFKCKACAHDE
ncbi:BgTH12-04055 [Blumeria graminis f. sp. triticale]|uniref:BgTH12-04055 n=1 Tax=Blumeria graminis f. sp. triticale TaxID=1689686 RepID=A0A9W4D269_BLUGR|nr:BgTH12-04055 [Blumeria graminis f. sp. triticale]